MNSETCQETPSIPSDASTRRVESIIAAASLEQKLAQLVGLWAGASRADGVAPQQDRMLADGIHFESFAAQGLGQLTRHYGTTPLDATPARAVLEERQRWLRASTPLGIGAQVHEECLTGVLAWGATSYPTPLAWGATFNPELVRRMSARIGADLASLGIHQGLAPVLDVVRDLRWGRVEECIAEDPLLVGEIGSAYVAGIESTGRVATLKHFAAYSGSRAGRNLAPVGIGARELEDVFLPPFERAIREGGARSVMNSYTETDGAPVAADPHLLTEILRDRWGFTGTVVADYFAVTFLQTQHRVAASLGDAAALALTAGIDVELPTGSAYLQPLLQKVRSGEVGEDLVDRALRRVLLQKDALGLLDDPREQMDAAGSTDRGSDSESDRGSAGDRDGDGDGDPESAPPIDLDSAENREIARLVAEESVVLLSNNGMLPLSLRNLGSVAIIGPNATARGSLLGCYSFVNHVLTRHPDVALGIEVRTVAEGIVAELAAVGSSAIFEVVAGSDHTGDDRSGFAAARQAAERSDLAIVVVGDRSGMFGRGTSGEGCDVVNLALPGVQHELVEAVLDTGTPTILVLVTGRPYVLDGLVDRAAATVQAFLPGQEGAGAIAGILSGRVNPSGRLPVGVPTARGTHPAGYLHPLLGEANTMSSADPTPSFPFGFGLSYTRFETGELRATQNEVGTDGTVVLEVDVANTGDRAGAEVLQLYVSDPVASVTRPVAQLVAFRRVTLQPGERARIRFELPSRTLSFTDRLLERVVEPGRLDFFVGSDCRTPVAECAVELTGARRVVPAEEYAVASSGVSAL